MEKKTGATFNYDLNEQQESRPISPPGDETEVTSQYDPVEFGTFLRYLKGTRSAREFAIDTDLSESFVSKAVNGLQKNRPSKRTVLKLLNANSERLVDKRKLFAAAGYEEQEFDGIADTEPEDLSQLSTARMITRYYGEDPFTAMCELLKALTEHGLKGDITCRFYQQFGYFEATDDRTGQVYVGINAYLKPPANGSEENGISESDKELRSIVAIAFSTGQTFSRVIKSDDAKEKIVYILTDNERIFQALRDNLPKNETKATIVVMTDDHQGFCQEIVLNGEENNPISLVD